MYYNTTTIVLSSFDDGRSMVDTNQSPLMATSRISGHVRVSPLYPRQPTFKPHVRFCGERLLRQARLAQAISELLGVRGVPEWQSADMIRVGVSRIDFLELAPDPAGLVRITQMPQR